MSPEPRAAGAPVRAAAAQAVAQVLRTGAKADDVLAAVAGGHGRDASLLAALVYGALRWHHRLAWQVGQLVERPLRPKDADLDALLRIGLLQLQELRIPDHAAVSATVDAASVLGRRAARGLVNAVLRRFQRERSTLDARMASVPQALFSHPDWLIEWLEADWPGEWRQILEANNRPGPMWLRVNTGRTSVPEYLERLAAAGLAGRESAQTPAGILLDAPAAVGSLPGFEEGFVSVQDGAAQLAAGYLELGSGQRVLDACAAPGGKAAHALESCPGIAELWAIDRDADRLRMIEANLARLHLSAKLVHGDAADPAGWWDHQPFDRILLDAPCSASGVIRRHPDIKVLRRPEDCDRAVALQAAFLDALWPLLKPGGRLVYATCSVLRRENNGQIARFVAARRAAGEAVPRLAVERQTLPGEAGMDGFYYACLDKPDVVAS